MTDVSAVQYMPNETLKSAFETCTQAKKRNKISVTARFDADVVEWYRSKGKGYQSVMNAALRACMEVEQNGSSPTAGQNEGFSTHV